MVVCRNWTGPGSCSFGDVCRYEHPGAGQRFPNNYNRYGALDNSSNRNGYQNDRNTNHGGGFNRSNGSSGQALEYQLDEKVIRTDLSTELPQWILSAYGPGRNAPEQLFGGPRTEQSFEEMRVLHYLGLRSGNAQQVAQEADKLKQETEQKIRFALNNMDGAIQYILDAAQKHPNRVDIVQSSMSEGGHDNVFSQKGSQNHIEVQPTIPSSNPFGNGHLPNQPAFGATSQSGAGGAFGQPSALGLKPNPFAAPTQSAFGAPSQPGVGAFGQPSGLGSKPNPFATAQPAFGAPSQPGVSGAFGQPSALGQKPNPFSNQPSGSFVSFTNPGTGPQPASNPFAQPPTQTPNPFAQPPTQTPNPFARAQQTPFGAPSPAGKDPFAQSSKTNPFASPAVSKPQNPFASATPTPLNSLNNNPSLNSGPINTAPHGNPFGTPISAKAEMAYQPIASGDTSQHPPLASYTTTRPDGKLATFKGRPVVFKNGEPGFTGADGTWQKIWFPEGPPKINKDSEIEGAVYDNDTKAAYAHLRKTGTFANGVFPMLPPKQEWCLWDF